MISQGDLLLNSTKPVSAWKKLFLALFQGDLPPTEIKALLLLLAKKGERAPELTGCLQAVHQLETVHSLSLPYLVDVCGTGGDGKRTFNISTISAFVIAGAGGYVAKHGNRAVSSQAGSSDLMEALGVRWDVPFKRMVLALRQYHLGYFHAPLYHPIFSKLQPLRRELGVRTLFNVLGPLLNPIRLSFQMIGVSQPHWLRPQAKALASLRRKRAAVFQSEEGMDELSTRAASDILYVEARKGMQEKRLDPKRFRFSKVKSGDYDGGDLETNREIALGILENRLHGPQEEVVLLNSGFALWLVGLASSIEEGIERARWSLRSHRASEVLEGLRKVTQRKANG